MLGPINWVFHLFFMTFFVVLASVLFWRGRQHRLRWSKKANKLNLIFQEKGGQLHQAFLGDFRLLGNSVINDPSEMLSGRWCGRDLLAFNWFFQSSTSFSALRAGFICLVVKLNKRRVRLLTFDRSLSDFTDPAGESHLVVGSELFAARYGLFCKNRKAADELLNPKVIEFLLETALWLEVDEDRLLLAWQGAYEPNDLELALKRLQRLLVIMGEIAHESSDILPRKV